MKGSFASLLLLAASPAFAKVPVVVARKGQLSKSATVLSIRGGDIDKAAVANALNVALGAYAGVSAMAPQKAAAPYGFKNPSSLMDMVTASTGTAVYAASIAFWCLAHKNTSVNTAIGISAIPWILRAVHAIVNEKPKEFGYSPASEYLSLALASVVANAALTDAAHADTAIKWWLGYGAVSGAIMSAKPQLMDKLHNAPEHTSAEITFMRNFGKELMGYCVYLGMLIMGKDNLTAWAYSNLACALGIASMIFVTKDFETVPKGPFYAFLALRAGLGLYLLAE
jgi:hypothetical protein